MKNLKSFFAAIILMCCVVVQAHAQTDTRRNKAQLSLQGKTETYNYESKAVTFYLNMENKSVNFYAKSYTFVMDMPDSEQKVLLINALRMNSEKSAVIEFKSPLPANFTMPAASQSKKVMMNGTLSVAGANTSVQIPMTVSADAKKNYSYSLHATIDLKNLGVELPSDVLEKTTGVINISMANAIQTVTYRK
ncbi:hypothetical protein SAMN05421780_106105 [Flexibacter flexilis DSM 6793]|uniref:YceI-like domain-containing protein n=1 Tax=Flexibacter flexilis DSM 6793 TaxID=927664 RepID=A0A1I1K267_9BACT|nr:hypothetical protein [Flexibacter flexilis]SFC52063.1 hypothetical protein SAMN05421780_106105 [Flexibacter flexilis DSM 6793]